MALFDKFKAGLTKTRNFFAGGFNKISASLGYFDDDMIEELEDLLVCCDVGVPCAGKITDDIKQGIKESGDRSRSNVLTIMENSMLRILGSNKTFELSEQGGLTVILMIGVNGTGKTTTCGKLAYKFKNEGKKVILAAADTFRAAAIEQLQFWAEKEDIVCISHSEGSDPAAVVFDAISAAKARHADVLIVDTAGRLHNKKNLMNELEKLHRIIQRETPEGTRVESLLVLDATTGQNGVFQARAFNEAASLTGIVLTKLDGNSKGGVVLAVVDEINLPIYFAGLGEKVEDLQSFDPEIFVKSLMPEE